jgi:hypothetical protein
VGVLHGVREEMRESERSLQFSKEWKDVVVVSTPGTLDLHQYSCAFELNHLLSFAEVFFIFLIFGGIFDLIFIHEI